MSEDFEEDRTRTVEDVRTSLRSYPAAKEGWLMYFLKAYAVTLEVFLHSLIGERYLSWPRALTGLFLMWVVVHIGAPWNWQVTPIFGYIIFVPHFTFTHAEGVFGIPFRLPMFTSTEFAGVSVLATMMSIYYAFAQWRMLEIFLYNRFSVTTHNRSSGEPYAFWDKVYMVLDLLNFRSDLVKQVCEPLVCLSVTALIYSFWGKTMMPVVCWLGVGSVLLFLKAWLENRARKRLILDRIANQMDVEAVKLQKFTLDQSEGEEFEEVPALGENLKSRAPNRASG